MSSAADQAGHLRGKADRARFGLAIDARRPSQSCFMCSGHGPAAAADNVDAEFLDVAHHPFSKNRWGPIGENAGFPSTMIGKAPHSAAPLTNRGPVARRCSGRFSVSSVGPKAAVEAEHIDLGNKAPSRRPARRRRKPLSICWPAAGYRTTPCTMIGTRRPPTRAWPGWRPLMAHLIASRSCCVSKKQRNRRRRRDQPRAICGTKLS